MYLGLMTSISYDSKFMRQIIFLFNRATIAPVIVIKKIRYRQGRRNSIISGEAPQVKEHTRAGNFKTLL